MFQDVQKLKIKEAEDVVAQLKAKAAAMHDEVRALKDKLWDLEEQEKRGLNGYRGQKRFSSFERLITKRKAYREYQAKLAELKTLPDKIAALNSQIEIAEMQANDEIAQSGVLEEIDQAQKHVWQIQGAKTLAEIGVTPVDAIALLENNEITPVLDESDYAVFERPREYETKGKAALCAVHKMAIMPENSHLFSLKEAGVEHTAKITLDGQEYQYNYLMERDTVHVALNDEVSSHNFGDWDHCPYTVLQPFDEIPNEKIGAMVPNDTYTRGGIDLTPNAWILCPENEVETVKELNPHVHILGYKGESSLGLAAPFLSQLGYRAEKVGMWGWDDEESQQQFYALAKRENLNIVQHDNSTDAEDEVFQIYINKAIALMKMLMDKNLVQSPADFERLQPQLDNQLSLSLAKMFSKTQILSGTQDLIDDVAVVANKKQVVFFANKMQRAGMPLSGQEQSMLQAQLDFDDISLQEASAMRNGLKPSDFAVEIMLNSALRARTMQTERAM